MNSLKFSRFKRWTRKTCRVRLRVLLLVRKAMGNLNWSKMRKLENIYKKGKRNPRILISRKKLDPWQLNMDVRYINQLWRQFKNLMNWTIIRLSLWRMTIRKSKGTCSLNKKLSNLLKILVVPLVKIGKMDNRSMHKMLELILSLRAVECLANAVRRTKILKKTSDRNSTTDTRRMKCLIKLVLTKKRW